MKKSYELDMCNGPILGKILVFAIPLMISGILQLLFNAADIIVVGRFTGSQALAAVGSTSALINLIINLLSAFRSEPMSLLRAITAPRTMTASTARRYTSVLTAIWGRHHLDFLSASCWLVRCWK